MLVSNVYVGSRLQEKLLANLDEDQQNDASFTGGDEVGRPQHAVFLLVVSFQVHLVSSRWLRIIQDVTVCLYLS